MGRPVVHFEIMGRDAEATRAFYGELFGWRFDTDNPQGYGIVPREENLGPGGVGIGGGVGSAPGAQPYVSVYVGVPDVGAALREAERLGGSRAVGPEAVAEGVEVGMFADPDGNMIGLFRLDG